MIMILSVFISFVIDEKCKRTKRYGNSKCVENWNTNDRNWILKIQEKLKCSHESR